MIPDFPTDLASIRERIDRIDPILYARTRNHVSGAVTYLSPYISRGVISTRQVLDAVLGKGYALRDIESFVKELCWRDHFQRVALSDNALFDVVGQVNDGFNFIFDHASNGYACPIANHRGDCLRINAG